MCPFMACFMAHNQYHKMCHKRSYNTVHTIILKLWSIICARLGPIKGAHLWSIFIFIICVAHLWPMIGSIISTIKGPVLSTLMWPLICAHLGPIKGTIIFFYNIKNIRVIDIIINHSKHNSQNKALTKKHPRIIELPVKLYNIIKLDKSVIF